ALMNTVGPLSVTRSAVPAAWQDVQSRLGDGETIIAWLELDLDAALHFTPGNVVLTNLRLLSRGQGDAGWQDWALHPDLSLRHADHAGVGSLELVDAASRLALWRYTLGRNPAALQLIAAFEALGKQPASGAPAEAAQTEEEEDDSEAEEQAPSP